MASDVFTFRINETLKKEFSLVCLKTDFSVSTAVNMFFQQSIDNNMIDNSLLQKRKRKDELYRWGIRVGKIEKEKFRKLCEEYKVPASAVLKNYMEFCVSLEKNHN